MGLLDAFNTEEGQQALGLLAAAGPRFDGAGFGQRLMEGLSQGQKWKQQQQEMAARKQQQEFQAWQIQQARAQAEQQATDSSAVRGAFTPMSGGQAMANGQGPTIENARNIGQVPQFDPRQFLAQNPQASLGALKQAMELNKSFNPDPEYGWHTVEGSLVRTDKKGGAEPVFKAGPKFDPNKPFNLGPNNEIIPNEPYQAFDLKSKKAGASTLSVNTDNLGLKPKDRFDMEDKLRNDYVTATKSDSEIVANAQDLRNILSQGGALKDQAAIYKFAKSLDPMGAVREADYAAIVRTAGGLDYVTALFNKALTGEQLSANQRKEMSALMDSMSAVAQKRLANQQKRFTGTAKMYNLKPENIFADQGGGDGWGIVKE